MSQRGRFAVIALAVVAVAAGFVIASSGGEEKKGDATTRFAGPRKQSVPRIVIRGGKPVGGVREIAAGKGDTVRFTVASDVADEIHVHGYDLKKDLPKGGTVSFAFPATIDGVFEVELEQRGQQIASLRVDP